MPAFSWAFCDIRRFGKLHLTTTTEELERLAPDALSDLPGEETFAATFQDMDKALKTVLLDQNLLLSGLGNWTADEALYQAALHPETRASLLGEIETSRLRATIKHVLETAIERRCRNLPDNWLYNYRWGKGDIKDFMGRAITHIKSGGRNSAVVLDVQHKQEGASKRKGPSNLQNYRQRVRAEREAVSATVSEAAAPASMEQTGVPFSPGGFPWPATSCSHAFFLQWQISWPFLTQSPSSRL